jgi:MFS family permease
VHVHGLLTLPFYLQTPLILGGEFGLKDTFTVGLYMFPAAIAQLIIGPLGGAMSKKRGSSTVLAMGMGILVLGLISLVFLHADFWQLSFSLIIFGAGVAMTMVSMINVVVDSCPQSEFGAASGMNTLFRIVGGSIGPVLAAVILAEYKISIGNIITPFSTETGYMWTWAIAVVFAVIGLAAAIVLKPRAADKCDIRPQELPPPGH